MDIFKKADILLPKNIDNTKWSVVACDQYTSQPDYWKSAADFIGDAPSALNIIFPELYLNQPDAEKKITAINQTMHNYLNCGLFEEFADSLLYVERTQRDGRVRRGIIGTVDLECYDFSKGSHSYIRATEGTVMERIPPRVKIRQNAPLELPHVIMLFDDRENQIMNPLNAQKNTFRKVYDFDLMMDSGHLCGYLLNDAACGRILSGLDHLADPEVFSKKYNTSSQEGILLFAVGDGNHSLATAKTCWEAIKKELSLEEQKSHPARFALVEIMNIHDPALDFEPIHRMVFNTDPQALLHALLTYYPGASYEDNGGQKISYIYQGTQGTLYISDAPSNLAVGTLQKFLDEYITGTPSTVDYIHGADTVKALSQKENSIGFFLPKMSKNELFETIIHDGALPRKTFSMGEAEDKRFYMECKKVAP